MKERLLALPALILAGVVALSPASAFARSGIAVEPRSAAVAADVHLAALGTWHRLSEDQSKPAPEHQRLTCLEGVAWVCAYDKIAEPSLNFFWNGDTGYFYGRMLTAADGWTCPSWFPAAACQNVTKVIRGSELYVNANDGAPFLVGEDLVITGTGADAVLWLEFSHWQGPQFVCPWYRTFAQALAADPFPIPFDGTDWPPQSCTVAA